MTLSIRNLLVLTVTSSFLFVVVMVAYAVLNSYANLREISNYIENKNYVMSIRDLERDLGQEMHLGTLVLNTHDGEQYRDLHKQYLSEFKAQHDANQKQYRAFYEEIERFAQTRQLAASASLGEANIRMEEARGLFDVIINDSYEVHVETWQEAMESWIQQIASFKIDLFVPQNVQGLALKHHLVTETAVDEIYNYVLRESQIITGLLAKQEPLTQEEVDRITFMRGFTETAMRDLSRYIQAIDLSGDITERWKLSLLESYRNVELAMDEFSEVRREIYAAVLIDERARISMVKWNAVLDKTLKSIVGLQQEIEKPSVISLSEGSQEIRNTLMISMISGSMAIGGMVMLFVMIVRRVLKPVTMVTDNMQRLVAGDVNVNLPKAEHQDEIGQMLNALERFRDTQRQLASQSRLMQLGEEVAHIGHWEVDEETDKVTWSKEVYAIHGISMDDYVPKMETAFDFFHPADRLEIQKMLDTAYEKREPVSFVKRLIRSDTKEVRFVDVRSRFLLDGAGRISRVYGTMQDVTERVETEKLLEAARDRAEEATRLKSEFLANMSHEIRTPMNGVIGLTNLLLEEELTDKQRSYALGALGAAENLLQIVNDILDFSKIEAGKLKLEQIAFDMVPLIDDVAQMTVFKAHEKGLELIIDCPPDIPSQFIGDQTRVRQIMMNLVSNAIKFTSEGHVMLRLRALENNDGEVRLMIAVQDTGIGIPKDRQSALFSKFEQVDASTTRQYGGTGLGLAICKELSEMMGGSITIESEEGKGTCFKVILPFHVADEADENLPTKPQAKHVKGSHVLLAEPNPLAAEAMANELRHYGARVSIAQTMSEAMTLLKEACLSDAKIGVVFIASHLKDGEGLVLGQRIREDGNFTDVRTLLFTESPGSANSDIIKSKGFSGYLPKPILPFDLIGVLDHMLAHKQKKLDFIDRHQMPLRRRSQNREALSRFADTSFQDVRILLAEDNHVNAEIARTVLQRLGCRVLTVTNGRLAVEIVEEQDFDLILMDCQMPEMDGFEATRKIRAYEKKKKKDAVPIIAFTANAFDEDREACIKAGMDDYITKPVQPPTLAQKLREHLPNEKWFIIPAANDVVKKPAITEKKNFKQGDVALNLEVLETLQGIMSNEKMKNLVDSFTQTLDEDLPEIDTALEKEDVDEILSRIHRLKSSGSNLGCSSLTDEAEAIENSLRSNKMELGALKKRCAKLKQLAHQYRQLLNDWLDA